MKVPRRNHCTLLDWRGRRCFWKKDNCLCASENVGNCTWLQMLDFSLY